MYFGGGSLGGGGKGGPMYFGGDALRGGGALGAVKATRETTAPLPVSPTQLCTIFVRSIHHIKMSTALARSNFGAQAPGR